MQRIHPFSAEGPGVSQKMCDVQDLMPKVPYICRKMIQDLQNPNGNIVNIFKLSGPFPIKSYPRTRE
jgi:hypothetical protein